jgi:hypothetical protein
MNLEARESFIVTNQSFHKDASDGFQMNMAKSQFDLDLEYRNLSNDQKIKDSHGRINKCVENLDDLLDKMMQKQELDFLAAYRGHMLRVQ